MGDLTKVYPPATSALLLCFKSLPTSALLLCFNRAHFPSLPNFTSVHVCAWCVCGGFGYFYNWPRHSRTCPYLSLHTQPYHSYAHMRLTKALTVSFMWQPIPSLLMAFCWIRLPSFVTIITTFQCVTKPLDCQILSWTGCHLSPLWAILPRSVILRKADQDCQLHMTTHSWRLLLSDGVSLDMADHNFQRHFSQS